jgi:ABC-type polysaccharide/polyol phosphate export permease
MVKLLSMLKKEVLLTKRNISIILLIVMLPLVFGQIAGSFKTSLPKDTPILIVAKNDDVTRDDMDYVEGWTTLFSEPVIGVNKEDGIYKLQREEAYLLFVVPPNVTQTMSSGGEFEIYVDNSFVPVEKVSEYVVHNVEIYFTTTTFKGSDIVLKRINDPKSMPEYMLPGFIMLMTCLMALTILPYSMGTERNVIRRLKIERTFGSMVAAKMIFFVLLVIIQLLLLRWSENIIQLETGFIDQDTFVIVLLTMIYLSAISLSITFLTKFSTTGNLINTLILFLILLFSGTFYPVGFFPIYLQKMALVLPSYYSMVMLRGAMLKNVDISIYSDWMTGLIVLTIVTLIILLFSVKKFRDV